jgi:hypothetical protein
VPASVLGLNWQCEFIFEHLCIHASRLIFASLNEIIQLVVLYYFYFRALFIRHTNWIVNILFCSMVWENNVLHSIEARVLIWWSLVNSFCFSISLLILRAYISSFVIFLTLFSLVTLVSWCWGLIWFLLALILEFVDLILMIAATNDLFFQFSFDYMDIFLI